MLLLAIMSGGGMLAVAKVVLSRATSGLVYSSTSQIPYNEYGAVLGCAEWADGQANPFFTDRMAAAAELFHAGKVRKFVASGVVGSDGDEAELMKQALVSRGIPAASIIKDDYGVDTMSSVVRLAVVFHLHDVTVVSGPCQVRRAIFVARNYGLNAIGYEAQSVPWLAALSSRVREELAQIKVVFDVWVRHPSPSSFIHDN
jgi:SanA protein